MALLAEAFRPILPSQSYAFLSIRKYFLPYAAGFIGSLFQIVACSAQVHESPTWILCLNLSGTILISLFTFFGMIESLKEDIQNQDLAYHSANQGDTNNTQSNLPLQHNIHSSLLANRENERKRDDEEFKKLYPPPTNSGKNIQQILNTIPIRKKYVWETSPPDLNSGSYCFIELLNNNSSSRSLRTDDDNKVQVIRTLNGFSGSKTQYFGSYKLPEKLLEGHNEMNFSANSDNFRVCDSVLRLEMNSK